MAPLLQRCSRANISLMLTLELLTVSRLADMGIAHLSVEKTQHFA